MGCTDCGRKGGCDARKGAMFAAVDDVLARVYPTRRWSDRDEEAALGAGLEPREGEAIAEALATRLRAATIFCPGSPEETCDWIYVLCVGRPPSLIELREGMLGPAAQEEVRAAIRETPVQELYLRVALSTLARFAAVQQVAVSAHAGDRATEPPAGEPRAAEIVLVEAPRAGVFDPILLRRLQGLVGVLAEHHVRHLDFGEIVEPPAGFDPGDYPALWGGAPSIANYLFYPQAAAAITTATLVT